MSRGMRDATRPEGKTKSFLRGIWFLTWYLFYIHFLYNIRSEIRGDLSKEGSYFTYGTTSMTNTIICVIIVQWGPFKHFLLFKSLLYSTCSLLLHVIIGALNYIFHAKFNMITREHNEKIRLIARIMSFTICVHGTHVQ